jgi:hypothetical protein
LKKKTPQYICQKSEKMTKNITIRKAEKHDCRGVFDLSIALAKHHDMEHYLTISYEDFEAFGFGDNPACEGSLDAYRFIKLKA